MGRRRKRGKGKKKLRQARKLARGANRHDRLEQRLVLCRSLESPSLVKPDFDPFSTENIHRDLSLTMLPAELIACVTNYVDTESIFALMLSCSAMRNLVFCSEEFGMFSCEMTDFTLSHFLLDWTTCSAFLPFVRGLIVDIFVSISALEFVDSSMPNLLRLDVRRLSESRLVRSHLRSPTIFNHPYFSATKVLQKVSSALVQSRRRITELKLYNHIGEDDVLPKQEDFPSLQRYVTQTGEYVFSDSDLESTLWEAPSFDDTRVSAILEGVGDFDLTSLSSTLIILQLPGSGCNLAQLQDIFQRFRSLEELELIHTFRDSLPVARQAQGRIDLKPFGGVHRALRKLIWGSFEFCDSSRFFCCLCPKLECVEVSRGIGSMDDVSLLEVTEQMRMAVANIRAFRFNRMDYIDLGAESDSELPYCAIVASLISVFPNLTEIRGLLHFGQHQVDQMQRSQPHSRLEGPYLNLKKLFFKSPTPLLTGRRGPSKQSIRSLFVPEVLKILDRCPFLEEFYSPLQGTTSIEPFDEHFARRSFPRMRDLTLLADEHLPLLLTWEGFVQMVSSFPSLESLRFARFMARNFTRRTEVNPNPSLQRLSLEQCEVYPKGIAFIMNSAPNLITMDLEIALKDADFRDMRWLNHLNVFSEIRSFSLSFATLLPQRLNILEFLRHFPSLRDLSLKNVQFSSRLVREFSEHVTALRSIPLKCLRWCKSDLSPEGYNAFVKFFPYLEKFQASQLSSLLSEYDLVSSSVLTSLSWNSPRFEFGVDFFDILKKVFGAYPLLQYFQISLRGVSYDHSGEKSAQMLRFFKETNREPVFVEWAGCQK